MKILFLCGGNNGTSPVVQAQYESLKKHGLDVELFTIKGRCFVGYLGSIPKVRRFLLGQNPDIIHAHYSFCGFVTSLAYRKPIVTSLMGSDVVESVFFKMVIRLFIT